MIYALNSTKGPNMNVVDTIQAQLEALIEQ